MFEHEWDVREVTGGIRAVSLKDSTCMQYRLGLDYFCHQVCKIYVLKLKSLIYLCLRLPMTVKKKFKKWVANMDGLLGLWL